MFIFMGLTSALVSVVLVIMWASGNAEGCREGVLIAAVTAVGLAFVCAFLSKVLREGGKDE